MDFVLLLFFLYITLCCKPCRGGDLSSKAMLPVRGLCAVGIIFHHVTQNISCEATLVFKYFDFMGPILVAVFFAISGYALAAQYEAKGPSYLAGFLKKRLSALLVPYGVYILLYLAVRLVLTFLSGDPDPLGSTSGTVLYSWYVKAICFLYILYYLSHRISRGNPWGFRLALGLGLLGYVLFCRWMGYGIWWYNAIWAFPFGMGYHRLHKQNKTRSPWVLMGMSLAVFGASLVLRLKRFPDGIPGLAMDALISLAFPLLIFSFLQKFSIRSRVLDWLGSRSYEIYLAQGIPILLLRSGLAEVTSPLVFCGITVSGALLIAEGVCRIDQRLLKRITKKANMSY